MCLSPNSQLQNFYQQILDYVVTQSRQISNKKTLLATSDVVESLFGKYKQFSGRCPICLMGQMLLTISLSTMNLTTDVIQNALETVRFVDVKNWLVQVLGQSMMLSKRKILFSAGVDDT